LVGRIVRARRIAAAVHEEEVEVAIAVGVEERAAARHRLGVVEVAGRAAVLRELEAALGGPVGEERGGVRDGPRGGARPCRRRRGWWPPSIRATRRRRESRRRAPRWQRRPRTPRDGVATRRERARSLPK